MASLTLIDVDVSVGRSAILRRIGVAAPDGAIVAIVGPSGAGKSTLLRAVAGLTPVDRGTVLIDDTDVTSAQPGARDVSMVFQDPALLPRRDVARNVGFPLELRQHLADEIRNRVAAETRALHIEHLIHKAPGELSRGEQQLVQIARSMVRVPQLLLLDEPFASLDQPRRARVRREIKMLQRGYGVTTLMATNDSDDVAALADIVVVLGGTPGTVRQFAAPSDVRSDPVDLEAARLVAPLDTFSVAVRTDGDGYWLESGVDLRLRAWTPSLRAFVGETVTVGVRRGDVRRSERGEVHAVLERIVPGSETPLLCRFGRQRVMAAGTAQREEIGSMLTLSVGSTLLFDPDTGERIR